MPLSHLRYQPCRFQRSQATTPTTAPTLAAISTNTGHTASIRRAAKYKATAAASRLKQASTKRSGPDDGWIMRTGPSLLPTALGQHTAVKAAADAAFGEAQLIERKAPVE